MTKLLTKSQATDAQLQDMRDRIAKVVTFVTSTVNYRLGRFPGAEAFSIKLAKWTEIGEDQIEESPVILEAARARLEADLRDAGFTHATVDLNYGGWFRCASMHVRGL